MISLGAFRGLGVPPEVSFVGTATYRSTANATSHTVPVHANTTNGDLVVVLCSTFNFASYGFAPPSGWFQGHTTNYSTSVMLRPVCGIVADNSDLTFTFTTTTRLSAVAYTLRGGTAILEANVGVNGAGTSSTPPASDFIPSKKYMGIVPYAMKGAAIISSYSSGYTGTASIAGTSEDHGVFTSYFSESVGSVWTPGAVTWPTNNGWAGNTILAYKRAASDYPNDSFTGTTLSTSWKTATGGAASAVAQNEELLLTITQSANSYARALWKAPIPTTGTVTINFDYTPTTLYGSGPPTHGFPYIAIANGAVTRQANYAYPQNGLQLIPAAIGDTTTRYGFRAGVVSGFQVITGGSGAVSCAAGTQYAVEWIIDFDAGTTTVKLDTVTKIDAAAFSYTVPAGSHFVEFAFCGYGVGTAPTEKFDNIVVTHTA